MADGSVSFARVLAGLLCVGEAWPKAAVDALGNSVETSDLRFEPTWDQAATGFSVFIAFNPDYEICSLHSLSVKTQVGALIEVGLLEDCFAFCRVFSMLSLFESSIWPYSAVHRKCCLDFWWPTCRSIHSKVSWRCQLCDHVSLWYQCMLSWIINEY